MYILCKEYYIIVFIQTILTILYNSIHHIYNILCHSDSDCIIHDQSKLNNNNYTKCLSLFPNPHNGIFSFDNIFFSSLQIFISSTGHWAILMSFINKCYGNSTITIYWFILTFIYFFILLPLLLAFISDNFNDINLAKNALYLGTKKNTIFSCATANIIFYKISTSDQDKLYYAQVNSSHVYINSYVKNEYINDIILYNNKTFQKLDLFYITNKSNTSLVLSLFYMSELCACCV